MLPQHMGAAGDKTAEPLRPLQPTPDQTTERCTDKKTELAQSLNHLRHLQEDHENRPPTSSVADSATLEAATDEEEDQMSLGTPPPPPQPQPTLEASLEDQQLQQQQELQHLKTLPEICIRTCPIADLYELEAKPFARGKFAQVKRCVDRATGQCFAAKCIKKRRRSADTRHEILLEIEALKLSHASNCIVRLFEVFETSSEMILVLELAEGGELQRYLDEEERLDEASAQHVVAQVLDALQLLHANQIAHLDIKPQNILLSSRAQPLQQVKLCDFGISRRITGDCEIRDICGTPDYVAPEILRYDPINLATDMWSLGVLAYILLSGYSPFAGDNKQQTFCNITQAQLDFPQELFHHCSPEAIDFIRKLILREPSQRLTSSQARQHPWLAAGRHEKQ